MGITRNIKCSNCGVFNTDKEYCENCNVLISNQKKRELKEEELKKEQIDKAIYRLENPNLAEHLKKHPFFLYKVVGWILYSVIVVVSAIGAFVAWFLTMVAAG